MKIAIISMLILLAGTFCIIIKLQNRIREDAKVMKEKDIELTKYVIENVDMEKQMSEVRHDYEFQKDMADEIIKIREQSRALKHDMKNHTLVIMSYLEENRIEEAKQYTSNILDKLNSMYTYVNVGNSLLNFIINNKLSKAKDMKIEIKAEIENLPFSYMDSIDFSSLLNNILDNAIETAVQTEKKIIAVTIAYQKGFDTILVKNSIDYSVLEQNPDLNTTKSEPGHGMGMKQIRKIIKKYDGELDIYEEKGMFNVFVALPVQS